MRKKPAPTLPAQPALHKTPVTYGDVFAAFVREAQSIGAEVEARRAFQNELAEFMTEKGLAVEFEAWRVARSAKP
jgi:hypothetical protein